MVREHMQLLKDEQEKNWNIEDIKKDPEKSALLDEYIESLSDKPYFQNLFTQVFQKVDIPPKATVHEIISKRIDRQGLSEAENQLLQQIVEVFNKRMQSADNMLANLQDEDQEEMFEILKGKANITDKSEIPLWFKGVAVRNISAEEFAEGHASKNIIRKAIEGLAAGGISAAAYFIPGVDHMKDYTATEWSNLEQLVRNWKTSARDRVAEDLAIRKRERIDVIAGRHEVLDTEIKRYRRMKNDDERLAELQAAVGRQKFGTAFWNRLRAPFSGSGATHLNNLIIEYRLAGLDARNKLEELTGAVCSFDTSKDRWWKKIPDVTERSRAYKEKAPEDKPLTAEETRKMLESGNIIDGFKKFIGEDAAKAVEAAMRKHPKDIKKAFAETMPYHGAQVPIGNVLNGDYKRQVRQEIKSRGLLSKLLEMIYNSFYIDRAFQRAQGEMTRA
jgi:hypothetical protein